MKSFLKMLFLLLVALFLYDSFFNYLEERKKKQKDPWLHIGCKMAYIGEMGGNACEMCVSRHKAENQRILKNILKKWKLARGKAFDMSSEADLKDMLQIMENHGIGKIFHDK